MITVTHRHSYKISRVLVGGLNPFFEVQPHRINYFLLSANSINELYVISYGQFLLMDNSDPLLVYLDKQKHCLGCTVNKLTLCG